jgi:hypothetical protein
VVEIWRHGELLVEDLEVARCEKTSVLAEAEERLWRDEPEGRRQSEGGNRVRRARGSHGKLPSSMRRSG